jgi:hypothetical protein
MVCSNAVPRKKRLNWRSLREAVGLTVGAAAYLPTYGIAFAAAIAAEAMHGVVELVRRSIVAAAKLVFLPLAALACLVFPDKDTPVRRIVEGVKAWWREFA